MSRADDIFKKMCEKILNEGMSSDEFDVRARWEDGTPAHTKKVIFQLNEYDLREEFPTLTLRKTALKKAMDEILWIYQKKSNNIKDLNSKIWDQWADEKGTIGAAYGYQIKHSHIYNKDITDMIKSTIDDKKEYLNTISRLKLGYPSLRKSKEDQNVYTLDQMDTLIYNLKNYPYGRRLILSLWNVNELDKMNLQPCCWNCNFNVTKEKGELVLNLFLNQRSNDVLVANNWNVTQYAILLMMLAQVSGMIPGKLYHMICDAHIYDRHIPLVEELIKRDTYKAPKVSLDPSIKNFYEFTVDSLIVEDYKAGEQIKIPVAV